MIMLAMLGMLFSGVIFISLFTFIMQCQALGIDPQLLVDDLMEGIDVKFTCKLAGIVCALCIAILCQLTATHPLIHLGLQG